MTYKTLKKAKFILALTSISMAVVFTFAVGNGGHFVNVAEATGSTEPTRPSCPYSAQANRYIVNFSGEKLVSPTNLGGFDQQTEASASLPAGKYNISLASWDGYVGRESVSQPHEQWFVKLVHGGNSFAQSGAIRDLPDNVRSVLVNEQVSTNLVLNQSVDQVIAYHAYYPDNSSPNSVVPICAVFDKIPETPALNVTCSASPTNPMTGQTVTWTAHPTGGTGSYTYSWSGTDNLSGTNSTVSKSYSTSGTKTATITVASGSLSKTENCTVVVQQQIPTLTVSCAASPTNPTTGQTVTWTATVNGGSGNNTYSWSGTDGLSGSNSTVSKSYSTSGTKQGHVNVTSGNQQASDDCSVVVQQQIPNLTATCSASPSDPNTGEVVTWTANPTGGTGTYTYSWSGTNSLSGSTRTITKTYTSTGTKSALVTVTSGNQHVSADCTVFVDQVVQNALNVTCSVDPVDPYTDDVVNWSATATGGTGSYTYSWTGSDGFTSTSQNPSRSYGSAGRKTATVTVTSGSVSKSKTCNVTVRQQADDLAATCSVNNSNPTINQSVRWTANATGGTSGYTYSWSGTDGLSGNSRTISKTYSNSGTKSATVTVTSNGQSTTANCSTFVQDNQNNNFDVSCYANPSSPYIYNQVNWYATVNGSGNNSNYTYSWSGDEGLSGSSQNVYRTYSSTGNKYANVTVYSNGQSRSAQCSVYIQGQNNNNNLSVTCYANPSNPRINDQVTWYANASGGNNNYNNGYNYYGNSNYSYSWSGTDNLNGSGQTVYKSYPYEGNKQATVTVYSNGQSVTQTCNAYVQGNPIVYTPPTYTPPTSYVYLNQVPYTGAGSTIKVVLFALSLIAWSMFIAYMVIRKKALKNGVTFKEQFSHNVSDNIKALKEKLAKENRYDFLRK